MNGGHKRKHTKTEYSIFFIKIKDIILLQNNKKHNNNDNCNNI